MAAEGFELLHAGGSWLLMLRSAGGQLAGQTASGMAATLEAPLAQAAVVLGEVLGGHVVCCPL